MKKAIVAMVAAVLGAIGLSPAPAHAASGPDIKVTNLYIHPSHKGWCLDLMVGVSPAPGAQRTWDIALAYCQPFRWAPRTPREADVLTHGATYTHTYWDWTTQPDLYSYVGRALDDGRATVAYDRIGNGASTRPVSADITMTSDAWVLHQLIQLTRATGVHYVNSVGHSYGSGVVLAEAANPDYDDVDNVILTGYLHRPSNPLVTAGNYPANQDPKFAGLGLDDGWLTTRPGARAYGFHSSTTDPALIELDEANKDLVSRTGLLDFLAQRNVVKADNISNTVKVPVLAVNGELDAIFCNDPTTFDCADLGQLLANEAGYYQKAADFKVVSIRGSGHDLTLHPTAGASYGIISDWIQSH